VHLDWGYKGWEVKKIGAAELAVVLPVVFLLLWIVRRVVLD
jgi:hypothetical protein